MTGLALALVSVVVAIVLSEALLALLDIPRSRGTDAAAVQERAAREKPVWLPHPVLEHHARAGVRRDIRAAEFTYTMETRSVGTGPVGFRDDGVNGPVYLVATGDSMTWGHGVDTGDCWVEWLEKCSGADCVNLGMSNMTAITQEYHILRLHGLKLKPKVALVAFFQNDLEDDNFYRTWVFFRDMCNTQYPQSRDLLRVYNHMSRAGKTPLWQPQSMSLHTVLLHYSRVYQLYRQWRNSRRQRRRLHGNPQGFVAWLYGRVGVEARPDLRFALNNAKQVLLDIEKMCTDAGVKFVFVIVPAKEQVYWADAKPILAHRLKRLVDPDKFEYYYPQSDLLAFCRQHNIACIDPLPYMRAKTKAVPDMYYPIDCHFTVNGNRVMGEAVIEGLTQLGLWPTAAASQPTTQPQGSPTAK